MQVNRFDICSEHLRVPWLIQLFVLSAFPPDLEETRLLCAQMWRAWPDAVMSTSSRWRSGAREKSWFPSQSASNSHLRGQRHVTKLRYVVTFSKEVVRSQLHVEARKVFVRPDHLNLPWHSRDHTPQGRASNTFFSLIYRESANIAWPP